MNEVAHALFDTALGRCAIAWGPAGIVAVLLPERDEAALKARLRRHSGTSAAAPPPPAVQSAIDGIAALLQGEPRDLLDVPLDMGCVSAFDARVYAAARRIPPGRTTSYGALAAQIGEPGAARAVGRALGLNPFAPVVPCHRVLAAGGRSGGFSAHGGVDTKRRMLEIEHARIGPEPDLFG